MVRKLLFIACAIFLSLNSFAETTALGYCEGESTKEGLYSTDGNKNVSAAVYLTPDLLAPYDGMPIVGIKVALASKINIDLMTVWTRMELEGTNVSEFVVTNTTEPSLTRGWMECPLAGTEKINASDGLYIGLTYHQKAATNALSIIGTGRDNTLFVKNSDEDEWFDFHSEGILSVELLVEGSASFEYDIALMEASVDCVSDPYEDLINVRVSNGGSKTVESFTLVTYGTQDDSNRQLHEFHTSLAQGEKAIVICKIAKDINILENTPVVEVVNVNGKDDQFSGNNKIEAKIQYSKRLLVEEFTTEKCVNCPRVAAYLHEVNSEEAYKGKISMLCHHAGFYTDFFTQDCDAEIGWLYNLAFAPAVIFDRTEVNGSMAMTPTREDIRARYDKLLAHTPSTGIVIVPDYNPETRKLKVNIHVSRENNNIKNPTLSVYVTEDNVMPIRQTGADENFKHNHVIRAYNDTWGESIEWTGSKYDAEYEFDIDPYWDDENISVLAFVANRNAEVRNDNIVDNVAETVIYKKEAGIVEKNVDITPIRIEFYNLQGMRIATPGKGIFLEKTIMSDGSVKSKKVLL